MPDSALRRFPEPSCARRALAGSAIGTALFLGAALVAGFGSSLDALVLEWTRSIGAAGAAWIDTVLWPLGLWGGFGFQLGTAAFLAWALLRGRRGRLALFVLSAFAGAVAIGLVLKWLVGRARPPAASQLADTLGASFPSLQAFSSAALCASLACAALLWIRRPAHRQAIIGLAVLLPLLIGAGRILLAAHWLTDVVAGWGLGLAWASICWLATLGSKPAGN